jgi:hypothetical protein
MLKFYADNFVHLVSYFARIEEILNADNGNVKLSERNKEYLTKLLDEMRVICQEIGLPMSVIQIDRAKRFVNSEVCDASKLATVFTELNARITDEISSLVFLVMQVGKKDYYEKPNLFGEKVFNNFPFANFDIEEAGKCFATARYTACVMHLQRVLEVGLKSYGGFLGIASLATSAQPSWNKVLDETRKEIKERSDKQNTAKVWATNNEKEFCESVQPFLESVKTAWRNPSMHADAKYTEDEAEDIFSAVKRFMKHLAEHLDESGNFTP